MSLKINRWWPCGVRTWDVTSSSLTFFCCLGIDVISFWWETIECQDFLDIKAPFYTNEKRIRCPLWLDPLGVFMNNLMLGWHPFYKDACVQPLEKKIVFTNKHVVTKISFVAKSEFLQQIKLFIGIKVLSFGGKNGSSYFQHIKIGVLVLLPCYQQSRFTLPT